MTTAPEFFAANGMAPRAKGARSRKLPYNPLDLENAFCLADLRAQGAVVAEGTVENVRNSFGGYQNAIAAVVVLAGQKWAMTFWDANFCPLNWDFVPA